MYICDMNAKILYICLLAAVFTACGGRRDVERRLDEADAVMNCAPDSALTLLEAMCCDSLGGGQRARYALLLTKATDKCYKPVEDDSLISFAAEYYAGRGDSLEAQSLFYLGYYNAEKRISDKALVLFSRAYETALAAHDIFYAAMSAREMSRVYRRLYMVDEGLKWARIAKHLFAEAGKPVHEAWTEHQIADALIYNGEYTKAKELLDSIAECDYSADVNFRNNTLLNQVKLALQLDSYKDVSLLYGQLSENNYRFKSHDRLNQAKAAMEEGMLEDADSYLAMARELTMSEADSLYAGMVRSELYAARNNFKDAYMVSKIFGDELMSSDARLLTHPQTQLLTDNYKLTADNHRLQAEKNRTYVIGLSVACVLLVSLTYIIYRANKIRLKNKTLEAEKTAYEAEFLKKELEHVMTRLDISLKESDTLSKQNEKYQDTTTDIKNLFLRHINFLQNVSAAYYVRGNNSSSDLVFSKSLEKIFEDLRSSDVVTGLAEIIDRQNDNWVTRFKEAYPNLKESHYTLAIYVFIGLSPEAVTVLLNKKNIQAMYTEKSKLKKKMLEINGGQADSFMVDLDML